MYSYKTNCKRLTVQNYCTNLLYQLTETRVVGDPDLSNLIPAVGLEVEDDVQECMCIYVDSKDYVSKIIQQQSFTFY